MWGLKEKVGLSCQIRFRIPHFPQTRDSGMMCASCRLHCQRVVFFRHPLDHRDDSVEPSSRSADWSEVSTTGFGMAVSGIRALGLNASRRKNRSSQNETNRLRCYRELDALKRIDQDTHHKKRLSGSGLPSYNQYQRPLNRLISLLLWEMTHGN